VYVKTTFRHGWQAMTLAAAVEASFSAVAARVYAAFTEAVRYAEPEFVVAALLLVVLPSLTLALDALIHYVTRTPNLRAGVVLSLAVTIVSSAFNWYSMRRRNSFSRSRGAVILIGPCVFADIDCALSCRAFHRALEKSEDALCEGGRGLRMAIKTMHLAAVSSDANDSRAAYLGLASRLARKTVQFYVSSRELLKAFDLCKNNPFQPELKDMQKQ
jgi:hypothetical protein